MDAIIHNHRALVDCGLLSTEKEVLVNKPEPNLVKEPVQEAFNAKPPTKRLVVTGMKTAIGIALILLLAVPSLTITQLASATQAPSVPEFTLKQVDCSYDVPTTYTTNMYTGENITHPGYHVDKLTIDVIIKNQPFPRITEPGNVTGLFYNVQAKGSSDYWLSGISSDSRNKYAVKASTSDTTVVTIVLGSEGWFVPSGSQVDIRVQAISGSEYTVWSMGGGMLPIGTQFALDKASSWSNTQTITVGVGEIATSQPTPAPSEASVQPTPSASTTAQPTINPTEAPSPTNQVLPTQTPTEAVGQPNTQANVALGVDWKDLALTAAFIVIAVLAVVLVLLRRKRA